MIHLRSDVRDPDIDEGQLKRTAGRLIRAAGKQGAELSLLLTDDASMRALNRNHRGKDHPTDVLSFGPESDNFLGDIAISVETARRQASDYRAPLQSELNRLLIHGLLHLLGHDHHEPRERATMEAEERRLARAISMPWPYDE